MRIRPATAEDSLAVAEVVHAVFMEYGFGWEPEGYHADLYDLKTHYFDEGHMVWVAESDRIEGVVALVDNQIERLYVHPEARRKGIARGLMVALLDRARANGIKELELWTDKRFEAAHALYHSLGGRIVGERICPGDPDLSPEWGMVLPVSRSSSPPPSSF